MSDDEKKEEEVKSNLDLSNFKSPYYLCSSDNPGNIICPINFDGKNYTNWSRLAANYLRSKNEFVFVDGSLPRLDDAFSDVYAWEKNNAMVIAWLYNFIDKNLHGLIAYAKMARRFGHI